MIKGRGAVSNPAGRFELRRSEAADDGWYPDGADSADEGGEPERLKTTLHVDQSRSIIARNESPDLPFSQTINPYRGCEHGCIYCFARPSHGYLNLSSGLDFETQLYYKPQAAALLEAELRKPGYRCAVISLGASTDPYQPIERELKITRSLLEVMQRFRHPVGIVTKGALVERDIDLLQDLAKDGLAHVALSITTLDPALKRTLEPRAASGAARLRVLRRLSDAGIPTMVLFSPVIPFVNDAEMESVLAAARDAGARRASYIMLRLPYEVKDLFREWLETHAPLKAAHVLSLVEQMRGGKLNDPRFGSRMKGEGQYAAIVEQRFRIACRRLGFDGAGLQGLRCDAFTVPAAAGDQLRLAL
ncbi:PA0069 family radical SAM protein [Solimonas terrae]|uniref:PA0069 family radical SAM protein n=1 Tax=Solimonas terrae TaxID=1396819 RepID=A0A6M2BVA3_9GAMM|nr:PA0069 family radical SAM protein [Solimonas terrae]